MHLILVGFLGIGLTACKTSAPTSAIKLVGGTKADMSDFPATLIWTTEGANLNESYCTGSKVGEQWILTAAHCVLEQDPRPGETYLGPWRNIDDLGVGQKLRYSFSRMIDGEHKEELIKIVALILPPLVVSCLDDPEQNTDLCQYRAPLPDVALIKVSARANSTFARAPVASLDTSLVTAGDEVFMMGYGSEAETYTGPPRLKFSPASVSTTEAMLAALQGTYAMEDGLPDWNYFFGVASDPLVAGHKNLGFGDSGGPVYRKSSGGIVGVNSDGYCPIGNRSCSTTSNSTFARLDADGTHGVAAWLAEYLRP